MKLRVEKLGTIDEGEIDLSKDFIILTGPNNSGKSYMAYLIYGYYSPLRFKSNSPYKYELNQNISRKIDSVFNDFIIKNTKTNLTLDINKLWDKHCAQLAKTVGNTLTNNSEYIFSSSNLLNSIFLTDLPQKYDTDILRYLKQDQTLIQISLTNNSEINFKLLDISYTDNLIQLVKPIVHYLIISMFAVNNHLFFMPAERTAITILAKEVIKEKASERDVISRQFMIGESIEKLVENLIKKVIPRYPLAINDYINWVNDLGEITRNESEFANFADEIEQMILGGKVGTNAYGDIRYTPDGSEKQLEVHVSSSLVKSLSSLVLYFRHQAQENDLLIIDEPELNLHPDSQIIVARILAKAINKGFKLIISTHSDYIIKELNNLIMVHKRKDDEAFLTEFGYDAEMALDKERVGAYFFNNHKIEDLAISDTGISIPTINDAIASIDARMENIYYSIFDEETTE